MASALAFSLNSHLLLVPSISLTPLLPPHISTVSSSSATKTHHWKLNYSPRASAEGVPGELSEEESKFVPLNAESMIFGPPALLLLGFELEEAATVQDFLKQIGGDFLKIIYCTEDMITGSLWDAMNTIQPNLEEVKIAKPLPRICFLSGLSGEEMMMLIDDFPETGLEPAVFAALVPNSAEKPIEELIDEIMADHEMITKKMEEEMSKNPINEG
ncbi:PREDICTED: uncharacterized protein LOC101312783 [Fragaria vesca subsp. vesca]|uniref:uncharacterized protein LOC101312783 n=1 Tax=Fragaria vesca subsp. vesca TaxID=101020 RepID=UPI0002C316A0|nr:PREDICTED: uncharacterized protein LOC101312783 [Fragaria vesca subsp. vesca]